MAPIIAVIPIKGASNLHKLSLTEEKKRLEVSCTKKKLNNHLNTAYWQISEQILKVLQQNFQIKKKLIVADMKLALLVFF